MARLASRLAILLLLSGCASELVLDQDGALAVIPHQVNDSGHLVVNVMLNGQGPFEFAIDTGASISGVFEKALTHSSIEPIEDSQVHVLGMTGSGHYPIAVVDQVTVGGESWRAARVVLLPDSALGAAQIDGILGVDFLSRYAIWYSQRDRVVRLYPTEVVAQHSYFEWNSIPLYDMKVADSDVILFAFDMLIGTERISTLFDLGANVNLMNRRAARLLGVPTRRPSEIPEVRGLTGKTEVLTELIVWQLQISHMNWRNSSFLVGDFPLFEAMETTNRPMAIAGTSLFDQRDFIIDFERKRLLVRSRN